MNTKTTPRRFARTAIATAIAATALAAIPASGSAATQFGAKLDTSTQPSNSLPAHPCTHQDPGKACTIVENEARYRPDGGERAPKTGTIKKIRLVAGGPGQFRLQIAKVKRSTLFGTNEAKVVRNGPVIHYQGQSNQNWNSGNYNVESFKVDVPVQKGQYLAIKAKYTSALYCASGGNNILIYQPTLLAGGGFQGATSTDGCDLLLGATIK